MSDEDVQTSTPDQSDTTKAGDRDADAGATRVPISVDLVQTVLPSARPSSCTPPIPVGDPFTLEVTISAGSTSENVRILRVKTHNNVNAAGDPDERNLPLDQGFFSADTVLQKTVAAGVETVQFTLKITSQGVQTYLSTPGVYDLLFAVRTGNGDGPGKANLRRFGLVRVMVPQPA